MGLFSNLISGAVKVALTPVAVITDAVHVATGNDADNTKNLLSSAGSDFEDALDDVTGN